MKSKIIIDIDGANQPILTILEAHRTDDIRDKLVRRFIDSLQDFNFAPNKGIYLEIRKTGADVIDNVNFDEYKIWPIKLENYKSTAEQMLNYATKISDNVIGII